MNKRSFLVFLIIPFIAAAQSNPKYPGLLWKISGNGLKKPSYLYGTMHVSNRVAYYLSEQFFDALRSVDVVGLETNPGEWLSNMEKTGELDELSQFRDNTYNRDFYRSTFAVAFPEKRLLQGLLSYDPDIINGLLYRQNKTRENFEESTYIDLFIFQSAAKLNKKIISLEDFSRSEIMSRLAALPDDEGERSRSNFSTMMGNAQKLEDAYREGNLDAIDSLSRLSASKNMQKYLIIQRNHDFVATIDSVIRKQTLFSGVGAAHLPGDEGVIELLRKKGYTVEPVPANVTRKSNAAREKLDEKVKQVTFSRQFSSDSVFSVALPGKMYPILNIGYLSYHIHADMINGSYYTIVRLKHMGPMFNITAEQMLQKVDSLLFEHIPGRMLNKKYISTSSGIKGIEVVNRMRQGDEQHYQIFFTEQEMIMFKLGGKKRYATGPESKQFFNSIQFNLKPETSVTWSPPAGGFTVNLPGNHSYSRNQGGNPVGLVEDVYAVNLSRKQSFGIKHAIYNDFSYLEEDTFELNRLAKHVLMNFDYKKENTYQLNSFQGLPAISFSGKNDNGNYLQGRIVIKGVHYYLQYLVSPQPTDIRHDFFATFRIGEFRYLHPMKEINDREFFFTAKDEVTDNARSRFNEAYAKVLAELKTSKDTISDDQAYRSGSKFYYSPSSNEFVTISFEKFNHYDYRDSLEIDKKLEETFRTSTTLFIGSKKKTALDGIYKLNYILKDTATSRALDVRVFYKGGLMLEICAPFDTLIGHAGWTKDFMETFRPMDTLVGESIFTNRFGKLLADLSGTDSVKRASANKALAGSVTMNKHFTPEFVSFISSSAVANVNEDSRAHLFVNGGLLKDNRIVEPYKQLYKQYTDSFYLQLCLLKGLALNRTTHSYKAFYELLMNDAPLIGDENTIADVFSVLQDSVELCREFFPGFLKLTRYDEYRNPVYTLMADLVNRKMLPAGKYQAHQETILTDANLTLKRFNPAMRTQQIAESGNYDHLDKINQETVENIRSSLERWSNNTQYTGKLRHKMESSSRHPLVNYAIVLAPLYKSDDKPKQFILKVMKMKQHQISMPVVVALLKQQVKVSDSLTGHFAANRHTRAAFYSELERENLLQHFDKQYASQRSLAESLISSQKQLNDLFNNEKDKNRKDSISLVAEVPAANKYQKGTMYIYKMPRNKNQEEQWSAVFVHDREKKVSSAMETVSSGHFIDASKSQEENINELLDHFSIFYRKRALMGGEYE